MKTAVKSVRAAREHDAQQLAELCTQLGYESTPDQVRNRLRIIEQDSSRAIFVIELDGGKIAGFIDLDVRCLAIKDVAAEVCGLVISHDSRGLGLGRVLLQKAEEWAAAKGATEVSVRSNVIRLEAHEFYRRCGYEVIKQQIAFRKRL